MTDALFETTTLAAAVHASDANDRQRVQAHVMTSDAERALRYWDRAAGVYLLSLAADNASRGASDARRGSASTYGMFDMTHSLGSCLGRGGCGGMRCPVRTHDFVHCRDCG